MLPVSSQSLMTNSKLVQVMPELITLVISLLFF